MPRSRGYLGGSVAQSESRTVAEGICPYSKTLELVQDPLFVARLRSKLLGLLTEEGPNGTVHLGGAFQQLDRQFSVRRAGVTKRASQHSLDLWAFKTLFAPLGLSDLEVEVLFALFLDDCEREETFHNDADDGTATTVGASTRLSNAAGGRSRPGGPTIDGAEVMLAIRKMSHTISAQFHEILKTRVRNQKLDPQSIKPDGTVLCPFYASYRRHGTPPTRRDVFDFLTYDLGLTDSEAFLCLEYFSLAGSRSLSASTSSRNNSTPDNGTPQHAPVSTLDTEYIVAALFQFPLPDDVAYPLLMSKLVEAITNPNRGERSGMTAILEELLFYTDALDSSGKLLLYGRKSTKEIDEEELRRVEADGDAAEEDAEEEPPLVRIPCRAILGSRWMEIGIFRKFCTSMSVGLPSGEVDLLYGYLCNPDSGLLSHATLLEQVLLRYPSIPLPEVQRAASAMRTQLISKQGPHALNLLHEQLARFQDRTVPPLQFRRAVRNLGVSVPTVHIDAIRRVAGRCVQAVSLVRGPIPPSRSETIEKLFLLLLDDCGLVPRPSRSSDGDDDGSSRSHRAMSGRRDKSSAQPAAGQDKAQLLAMAVPKAAVVRRFEPELAPGLIPTAAASSWRQQLERYLASLHEDVSVEARAGSVSRRLLNETPAHSNHHPSQAATVQFLELAYFWGNVSPSIEEDAQFTLMLWKSFSMHRVSPPKHGQHTPSSPPPVQRSGSASQQGHERRFLRE